MLRSKLGWCFGRVGLLAILLAGLCAAFVLLQPFPLPASENPDEELEQVRAEINDLTRQIRSARTESSQVAQDLGMAQGRLDDVVVRLAQARNRVTQVETVITREEDDLESIVQHLTDLEQELQQLELSLIDLREEVEQQAVLVYMDASGATAGALLEMKNPSEVVVGQVYANDVLGRSEEAISAYEITQQTEQRYQERVTEERDRAEDRLTSLETRRDELVVAVEEVDQLRRQAQSDLNDAVELLDSIRADIVSWENHKEGLESDATRLEDEIRRLQQLRGVAPGQLAWPVLGDISSGYGFRIHPILGGRRLHTGIDIAGDTGTPIKTGGYGVVILAAWWGGYGNAVVVDHGGGVTTVYGHLSSFAVSVGQTVNWGDTVGGLGCTGYCTGPHLHFEVREQGVPVDPMKYLS